MGKKLYLEALRCFKFSTTCKNGCAKVGCHDFEPIKTALKEN